MNIVIVTREEFPFGGAATNRVLTYIPGIVAAGHKVTILCLFLSERGNIQLLDRNGECTYNGIKIKYVAGCTPWPIGTKNYVKKIYLALKARVASLLYLTKNKNNIDIVQMYSTDIKLYERYAKVCRSLGLKYIIERSELPDIVKYDRYLNSSSGASYIANSEKAFGLFDGWILETQNLVDYYSKFYNSDTKCVIVPMTVEVERFNVKKSSVPHYGKYIAYCGNMTEFDGVKILIQSYALVANRYPDIKLVLIGDSDEVPSQKSLVESLGIRDKVLFVGKVSRNEVPQLLVDAEILALASPTSDRACATMPCKVGEYLCTGNPVVVTGLGEINKYLIDEVSAYLAEPDSIDAFAQKLIDVLSDKDKARSIGQVGRSVAIENFGSEAQIKRIEEFYREVIQ